eukprot:CAMPEP_0173148266 /NCGR_PEP_ID=MMETSP1105-20130129/9612_1 /TAXON_ID=2985 /ORGANISM="Ochromonas sp., Strain BG-1" /LENGTH=903 /DNA_ID=CAMNT_0014062877 /DNA_START=252 /DNA_END=2963 /DNA_ORIENTATION=+
MRCTPWPHDISLFGHEIPSRYTYQILEYKAIHHTPNSSSKTAANRATSPLDVLPIEPIGKSFYYQGRIMGRNRTVIANDHFPLVFPGFQSSFAKEKKLHNLRPISALPFLKTTINPLNGESVPVLSHIAYYEITIHQAIIPTTLDIDPEGLNPCICIGVARPGFDIYHMMAGWDRNSYGFHGDDGLFFCGNSENGFRPIINTALNRFGAGDTVGFGIIYPTKTKIIGKTIIKGGKETNDEGKVKTKQKKHGEDDEEDEEDEEEEEADGGNEDERDHNDHGGMFFTKNGVLQAIVYIPDPHFFHHCWFPAIGTDAYNIIEVNYGNLLQKPFLFNILAFEFNASSSPSFTSSSYDILPEILQKEVYQYFRKQLDHARSEKLFPFLIPSLSSSSSSSASSSSLSSFAILPTTQQQLPPIQPYMIYPPFQHYAKDWKYLPVETRKRRYSSLSANSASDASMRGQKSRSSSLGSKPEPAKPSAMLEDGWFSVNDSDGDDNNSEEDDDGVDNHHHEDDMMFPPIQGQGGISARLQYLNFLLRRSRLREKVQEKDNGVDGRGLFHHRHLLESTLQQLDLEGYEDDDDDDEVSESDDDGDDHGGAAGIITTDPHQLQQMFFPYNSAGPFFLAFEDAYEEDEEDDVEDEGHEIFGADYADYEDLQGGIMPFSAAVRGSRTNLASLGGSTTTPIARAITPIKTSHLNEEEEDEGESENDVEGEDVTGMILEEERSDVSNPKDIGEGVLDWKKSLARSSAEKKNKTNSTSSASPAKTKKNSFPTPFQFPTFPTSSQQMYEQSQQMYEQFQSALQSMASAAVAVGGEGGGGSGSGGKRSKKKGFTLSSMFRSSSNTSLQEVSSPYARFLRGYPEGAMEAFYYDEGEDEGRDDEEEEGDEEENNDDDDGEEEDDEG